MRAVGYVDALVVGTILERLGREDAADLFLPTVADVDVSGLRTEAATIKTNLKVMAADAVLGKMDKEDLYEARKVGRARLDEIEAQLQAATVPSPLSPLVGAEAARPLAEDLAAIAKRCAARPTLDERTTDEILGYDENGLPS